MTALKSWVNLEVLTHTDLNLYVGAGGNLSHLFAEMATAAGQIPYSTGSKAVAVLAAGTGLLHMNGAGAPTITTLVNADVAAAAAIAHSKLGAVARTMIRHTVNQTLTHNVLATLNWDDEQVDNAGWHDDVTNNTRIVVPRAGSVRIFGSIVFDINATGYRQVRLTKGAGPTVLANWTVLPLTGQYTCVGFEYEDTAAAASDYYEIRAFQNSGAGLDVVQSNASYPTYVAAVLSET